jgi:diguanylate cyclase (GGDEF) domain
MESNTVKSKDRRGIKIQVLSRFFAGLGFLLLVLLAFNLGQVVKDYKALVSNLKFQRYSLASIGVLQNGSDDMTEQSRLFASTRNVAAMEKYFEIVEHDVREKAHDSLVTYFNAKGYEASVKRLDIALDESNSLMDYEIHSMKLISSALNLEDRTVPKAVRNYSLPDAEEELPAEEKLSLATILVNGAEYCQAKAQIDEDIRYATDAMADDMENDIEESMDRVGRLIGMMVLLGLLLAVLFVTVFILINILIIRPLKIYVKCVQENRTFDFVGSYELKYLALTYNSIFEVNMANQMHNEYLLEHDTLTGASSRLAFDEQKKLLSRSQMPIALIIFDVDHFKQVNDNHGHEAGDEALIRVVSESRAMLRSEDILARIGGDEFAVVLLNVYSYSAQVITEKLDKINRRLLQPGECGISLSISAGIAFSEHGYSEELFLNADSALYEAKQGGRCRSSIYTEK